MVNSYIVNDNMKFWYKSKYVISLKAVIFVIYRKPRVGVKMLYGLIKSVVKIIK